MSDTLPIKSKFVTEQKLNTSGDVSLMLNSYFSEIDEIVCNRTFTASSLADLKPTYYSFKYNNYRMYSWIVSCDPFSYSDDSDLNRLLFVSSVHLLMETLNIKHEFFIIFQYSPMKGLHAHLSILTPNLLSNTAVQELNILFQDFTNEYRIRYVLYEKPSEYLTCLERELRARQVDQLVTFSTNFQKIKSTAAYINYLQSKNKGTFYASFSSSSLLDMFKYFNSEILFPKGSIAKKQRMLPSGERSQSDNTVVNFMMSRLYEGVSDFQDLLKHQAIQQFLHLPSLTSIWQNCYMQFAATNTLEKNWEVIYKKISNMNTFCACAVLDWLIMQNISLAEFVENFNNWLYKITPKQNVLYFQGIPNAGKSYFVKPFWELFLLHRRCTNEEKFSFANVPGSGAILWDDPHITPEIVDMFKQLTEGENTMEVPVKGKASQVVNSTPRWFITSNKNLHRFCASEDKALQVRMYSYKCMNNFVDNICNSNTHYCTRLESIHSTTAEAGSSSSEVNFSQDTSVPLVDGCTGVHKIDEQQALSFILLASANIPNIYQLTKSSFIEYTAKNRFKKLCTSSINLLENDHN